MDFYTLWALYALKFYNAITIGEKRIVKGQCMNMYERYSNRELPEKIQRQAEDFASQGQSNAEYLFRAGYWCGKYIEKEDIDGENDRGPEDVQVRP